MINRTSASRPFVIPVFIPHAGCPHRCIFCDQQAITGHHDGRALATAAEDTIRRWLTYPGADRQPAEIAFYGGNFLGLDKSTVRVLLEVAGRAIDKGNASGIRFSTRPDSVTAVRWSWVSEFPVRMVELGAQSFQEPVLAAARRGHTVEDTISAVRLLKSEGCRIGIQLMTGLPGDSDTGAMASARRTCDLAPDAVRIYPTLVLKGSRLEQLMDRGEYQTPSLEESVSLAAEMYTCFVSAGIPVIRMGLQAGADLHRDAALSAGPFHPAFGYLVQARVFYRTLAREWTANPPSTANLHIRVHPRSVSRARGWKNQTIRRLCRGLSVDFIQVHADTALAEYEIGMEDGRTVSVFPGM
jgi:histone acetyltransferase (RNA polymerase elongator complex component)